MIIVYAPRALRDLCSISAYLAEHNASASRRVLAVIKSTIDNLECFPELGRPMDSAGNRRLPARRCPYLVFYRNEGSEVLMLHIRDARREPVDPHVEFDH